METISNTELLGSSVDTTGIDDLFDVTPTTIDIVPVGDMIEVSVPEAASRLGISKRTMWRRIKAGEIASRNDGKNTFVTIPVTTDDATTQPSGTSDRNTMPRHISVPADELTQLKADLERAKLELSSVTNRAQYLQGQVDLYEQHFKLLVDKSQSGSWWNRFATWFLGVR